ASLNLMNGFTPPMEANVFTGEKFLLGTDDQGRDLFSAILYGLRVSLFVGMMAVGLAMVLGVLLGLIAGYVGGWLDTLIMRLADIQMTFPSILIAMLIFGVARGLLPPELREEMAITVLILSIGLSEWVNFARTVRGSTMVEKEKEYVAAARLIGLNRWQIMLRHILPNVLGPVLVIATITLALAIIAEATLSFLGVGAPRTEPSLGTLIRIGQDFLFSGEWWILLFPALTLLALALSVNLFGDWLRDTLNPRLR
ncbi:MAG: ABC transporter permease, partial [Pseudomonadota bacterium]|nr:ABC transporter permease [Pseudomonadota bacterium]